MKSNILPFPALQAAPRDQRRSSALRGVIVLALLAVGLGLLGLTVWSLYL
jgi:hypothetical protein